MPTLDGIGDPTFQDLMDATQTRELSADAVDLLERIRDERLMQVDHFSEWGLVEPLDEDMVVSRDLLEAMIANLEVALDDADDEAVVKDDLSEETDPDLTADRADAPKGPDKGEAVSDPFLNTPSTVIKDLLDFIHDIEADFEDDD